MPTWMANGFDLDEALIAAGLVRREDSVSVIAVECAVGSEVTITTKRYLTREEFIRLGQAMASVPLIPRGAGKVD